MKDSWCSDDEGVSSSAPLTMVDKTPPPKTSHRHTHTHTHTNPGPVKEGREQ